MAQGLAKKPVSQLARRSGWTQSQERRGPNAVDMLKEDHDRMKKLFARVPQAAEAEQSSVAEQIFGELELHARAEEEIFYPAFASTGQEAADIVAVSVQEHQVVKDLIAELRQLSPRDSRFRERFDALRENVLDHATEEEETVFPSARLDLDLYELGRQMALLKGGGRALQPMRSVGGLIRRYPAQILLIGASILVVLSRIRSLSRP
jgi:hemerythrin superfamily protein